jgi:hypothetical protein
MEKINITHTVLPSSIKNRTQKSKTGSLFCTISAPLMKQPHPHGAISPEDHSSNPGPIQETRFSH